ncbi:MAG: aminotransferase class V-fold PLP-dependent enzyme [Chloroflexi bacterium]|nr:aminotransferase class V-fold PLP-dependent enzyme [Chloroflexota bacterium]
MLNTPVSFRNLIIGADTLVPLLDGRKVPYINLDNAASTPAMLPVQQAVDRFLQYYSSVHRGTGFKSQLSTHFYEEARKAVMRFVGANPADHACIFSKNSTESLNKLARRFPFTSQKNVVLLSTMEHHSNDLPWRAAANVVHLRLLPDGRLDEGDFDFQLEKYAGRVALVTITGASNVTGIINPVHRLAVKAHAAGAQIAVDCAQLAPHRKVSMGSLEDPAHLDYVILSAHKMYAPYGTGALVGRRDTFAQGEPDLRGGGEVEIVTVDSVLWSEPPERDEAGSPNVVGAIALAEALVQLEKIGMDAVARHEAELTEYALKKLTTLPGVHIYGDADPATARDRLGVIPLNLDGFSHFLLAAILGHEFGIGVRNGCFCAHPYVLHLLQVDDRHSERVRRQILQHDRREVPGMVRISFGLYNEKSDVDAFISALEKIQRGEFHGTYIQDPRSGEFHPQAWKIRFEDYFHLGGDR